MKRWIIVILTVAVVLGAIGWRFATKTAVNGKLKAAAKERSSGPVSVNAGIAGPRDLDKSITAVGNITTPFSVKLSPKLSGLVTYLNVREGDPVKAGEVLVKLDPDIITGQVLQNQANVAEAKSRLAQAQITQDPTNVAVKTSIEQQRAAVSKSEADLNQVIQSYNARIASSQASVTDAQAKLGSANAALASSKANLGSAQANYRNAQAKLNRELELYKQNYIAAQDVDDQKTAAEVAAASVDVAQKGVDAAVQAVASAKAVLSSSKNQLEITEKQAQADLADSRAALRQATESLKLAVSNRAQSPAYQANLNALNATVAAAEGQYKASLAQESDLSLASPVDGIVTQRALDPGGIAQPGVPVVTIEYLKWVYFDANVPVEQSSMVYAGQPATIQLDSIPGKTFRGKIAQVNPSADPTSHQFQILVKLENPKHELRPGMFGHVGIVVSKVHADVVVPREAVTVNPDGTKTVTVIEKDTTAKTVPVTTGAEDTFGFEIKDGLKAGQQIVTLTYQTLADGRKLKVLAEPIQPDEAFSDSPRMTDEPTAPGDGGSSGGVPPTNPPPASPGSPGVQMAPESGGRGGSKQ